MAPATDLAAKFAAEVKDVRKAIDDFQNKQKERMVASMARQDSATSQQQLIQRPQQLQERPMSTQTFTVSWSCRLSTLSRLPMPWQA